MYQFLKGLDAKLYDGSQGHVVGMIAAVSYDEGKTWPIMRFLDQAPDRTPFEEKGFGIKKPIKIDRTHGELKGYLAAVQDPDNWIHLVSQLILLQIQFILVGRINNFQNQSIKRNTRIFLHLHIRFIASSKSRQYLHPLTYVRNWRIFALHVWR